MTIGALVTPEVANTCCQKEVSARITLRNCGAHRILEEVSPRLQSRLLAVAADPSLSSEEQQELLALIQPQADTAKPWRTCTGPYQCLLTIHQLAEALGTCRDTIERWERRGVIPQALRVPKNTPTGGGRGRTWVRWDYWTVTHALAGNQKTT